MFLCSSEHVPQDKRNQNDTPRSATHLSVSLGKTFIVPFSSVPQVKNGENTIFPPHKSTTMTSQLIHKNKVQDPAGKWPYKQVLRACKICLGCHPCYSLPCLHQTASSPTLQSSLEGEPHHAQLPKGVSKHAFSIPAPRRGSVHSSSALLSTVQDHPNLSKPVQADHIKRKHAHREA